MHGKLIDDLGGYIAVATRLRQKPRAVSNWRKRGVPWKWRPAVEAMADRAKVKLPSGFFAFPGPESKAVRLARTARP